MKNFDFPVYSVEIICEGENTDAYVRIQQKDNEATVYLTARNSKPCFVKLHWAFESPDDVLVLGDTWERSYTDLGFLPLAENDRALPWYFIAVQGTMQTCFGVKTQPAAFVSFRYDTQGLTALLDCRNGGSGVHLCGRTVKLADFVLRRYEGCDTFDALCDYCKTLCTSSRLPKETVYGGNNWYYAYGESSRAQILSDAALQAELASGIDNAPFMVIDDGWQLNRCAGPWLPNEKFGDMASLVREFQLRGVRPGIWFRPLYTEDPTIPDSMKILRDGKRKYLDPTVPQVQSLIREDIARIKEWGFELLKFDFVTVDMFDDYGKDLTDTITNVTEWHFADRSKTSAEITLDFYRLIREQAGDLLLIGCNTVSHICAGLVELNRIGDDTSGKDWARTRDYGVNTLAFRLAQNGVFYLADADCVGILDDCIPWEKNRQWLDLLANSGTPLFVSVGKATQEQKTDLCAAYRNAQQKHAARPLDWMKTRTPEQWLIDGEEKRYCWN